MGSIGNKIVKRAEAMEKNIPELKAELVCMRVREMKIRNKK